MQSSCRKYSAHEESRLLQDIKLHKQGIAQLEKYEEKKKSWDQLRELQAAKKKEQNVLAHTHTHTHTNVHIMVHIFIFIFS